MTTDRLNTILANASERIAFVGDYHGNLHMAELQHMRLANQGINLTVQAGDFGFIWSKSQYNADNLNYLNKKLGLMGTTMLVVLGNHENYDIIDENLGDEPWFAGDNIVILPRAYKFKVHNLDILGVGGAPSIDRKFREPGKSWWPQEMIDDSIVEKAIAFGKADVVISHDAGTLMTPKVQQIVSHSIPDSLRDGSLEADLVHGRQQIGKVIASANPHWHIHGHYHVGDYISYGDQINIVSLNYEARPKSCYILDTVNTQGDWGLM